jgi:hypothetical protein
LRRHAQIGEGEFDIDRPEEPWRDKRKEEAQRFVSPCFPVRSISICGPLFDNLDLQLPDDQHQGCKTAECAWTVICQAGFCQLEVVWSDSLATHRGVQGNPMSIQIGFDPHMAAEGTERLDIDQADNDS